MKTSIVLTLIVAVIVIACDKGRFQTVPQLKLKSRNTDIVPKNGSLILNVEYTDKEGDVNDSIIIVRQRLNRRNPLRTAPSLYKIPNFPKMDKGEFEITLSYQFHLINGISPNSLPGNQFEIDTLLLKLVARDKAGNKSDTLLIDNVYVIR